jgi:very-short-patch-repair endonuclease
MSMITSRLGIPLTSPARTIVDLRRARPSRGGASAREVRRAIRQAAIMELPLLGPAIRLDRTRSDLERSFLRLCERHRLPPPENNIEVEGMELDFLWRASKVVVETDGYQYHGNRIAFEEDRKRDLRLRALGYQVVRLSYYQVTEEARDIVATLRPMLVKDPVRRIIPRRGKNSPR